MPTDDTWARDFGPIVTEANGEITINDFQFNGWGLKFASNKDNLITRAMIEKKAIKGTYNNCMGFALEGGSIESDGNGLLLTTSECLLSPNRNGDLSKEEILQHIESENFNQLRYLKKDYQNFKGYLKTQSCPKHMDYVNSDYAPNLLKFMKIKINGQKTNSYYKFLVGIGEDVPLLSDEQVITINYLSSLLPLRVIATAP